MSAIPFPAHVGWHRQQAAVDAPSRSARELDHPPTLEPSERILIRYQDGPANAIVGTDRAAHLRTDAQWRRIPWTEVERAGWDPVSSQVQLTLWPDAEIGSVIGVPADRRVAAFVTERVTSTQVLRRRIRVSPGAVATVLALRSPGEGRLQWRVIVHGDGAQEAQAKAAADQVLAEIRALVGS